MKTIKISISILLILTILLSCLTAAFAAGSRVDPIALLEAAGQDRKESAQAPAVKSAASAAAVEAVQALLANKTNINAAPPTDAAKLEAYRTKLALYEKSLSAYKALTQEEKDAFPVEDALKLLAAIDGRESYLIKEENPSLAYVEQHKAAYEKLDDLIGPHTVRTKAYEAMKPLMTPFEGTQKLNANTDFAKKPAAKPLFEAYLQNYKNADPLTRKYYDMLAKMELSVSGINIAEVLASELAPSKIAGWLSEDSFAGAKQKLIAAAQTDDSTAAFSSIQFENGDWGFENGDAEGFSHAVAAMLRPIANILHNGILVISNILYLPNSVAENGDYKYGAYEKLIPLLESLGLKGVLSSQEYTARFQAAAKVSKNAQLDALFLPIVSPIVTLVDELQANPLNTMLDLLPRLARTISTNTLNDSLNSFLHSSSLLSGVNIDLSGDAVNAMIDGQKISIGLGDNAQLTTTLKAVDWARLAGCGKLVLADSVSAANAYRTLIETNRADAYVVASQYLVKTVLRTRIEGKSAAVALGI
jgi:hypothetical protein